MRLYVGPFGIFPRADSTMIAMIAMTIKTIKAMSSLSV